MGIRKKKKPWFLQNAHMLMIKTCVTIFIQVETFFREECRKSFELETVAMRIRKLECWEMGIFYLKQTKG